MTNRAKQTGGALRMLRSPTGAGILAIALSAAALVAKLVVGLMTDSVAVLSDAIDSGQDLLAATITLTSVRLAARPASVAHPYGYGKIETVAAGAEAGFILLGAGIICVQAILALGGGDHSPDTGLGIITMVIVFGANMAVGGFVANVAREHDSPALSADAKHLFTNAMQAAAVVLGLALVALTGQGWLDPFVGLLLAAYLAWTAFTIQRRTFADILDVRLPPDEEAIIKEIVAEHAGEVRGYHRLRTRRSGPYREIDLHLIVPPETPLQQVHATCDRIEQQITGRLSRSTVLIHAEPDDGRFLGQLAEPASPIIAARERDRQRDG